MKTTAADI